MARNQERRTVLADAGIRVLAEQGARGLTHRAVDAVAGTPRGTASNYFATREDLISALVDRIGERLRPSTQTPTSATQGAPDHETFAGHLRDVVRRLTTDPHVQLALFELRLEASRRPAVAEALNAWRTREFQADLAFHEASGLPGGPTEIALFHYVLDGLMLDRLTVPLATGLTTDQSIDEFVNRIMP